MGDKVDDKRLKKRQSYMAARKCLGRKHILNDRHRQIRSGIQKYYDWIGNKYLFMEIRYRGSRTAQQDQRDNWIIQQIEYTSRKMLGKGNCWKKVTAKQKCKIKQQYNLNTQYSLLHRFSKLQNKINNILLNSAWNKLLKIK